MITVLIEIEIDDEMVEGQVWWSQNTITISIEYNEMQFNLIEIDEDKVEGQVWWSRSYRL